MAISYDQSINLKINLETEGGPGVVALGAQIESLGKEGSDAAPKFLALGEELKALGNQKIKVDGLDTAIARAKESWAALKQTRQEAATLNTALADARGANAGKDAIKLLQKALNEANRELSFAEKNWAKQTEALQNNRAAAAAAGVDVKNLQGEQTRIAGAVASATAQFEAQIAALKEKSAASRAAAAEEDRLAAIVESGKTRQKLAAQELLTAERKTYAEAEAAAKRAAAARDAEAQAVESFSKRTRQALADAFSATGIRSSEAIQSEILKIQQSLLKLGANAKVSGGDFDRAFSQAQTRISALESEMNGTVPAMNRMQTGVKGLGSAVDSMGVQLASAFAALQAGRAFIAANSQVESLTRSLTLLTGSSESAAAEMEYIRATAQRLGVDVLDAAKSYMQLIASTKGTALEGDAARQVFEAVSGAMATLGKSSAETSTALLAVNQMASKGVVSMEELRGQLGENLPGAMKAAANGAGLTVSQLTKMVESGKVLAEDLLPALAKGLNEMYGIAKDAPDSFAAQWARMKNAVTDFYTVVGESGVMKVLNEGLALTTFSIKSLVIGMEAAAGKTRELLGGPQWDAEKARASLEIIARGSDLLTKALGKSAEAGDKMRTLIREQSPYALQLQNAFAQANEQADKQPANLEKMAAARKAEAAAINLTSQLYDTEAQQRRAAVSAAQDQEAAMMRVAEQVRFSVALKETELAAERVIADRRQAQNKIDIANTERMISRLEEEAASRGKISKAVEEQISGLETYLLALKDERIGMGAESSARKEKIEALEKEVDAKKALADKAAQEAAASHASTLAAQAAAATYVDNAKRVYELRDAYEAANAAFERTGEAFVKGIATDKELAASKEEAQRALLLYRDALNDATAAAERHVTSERTASNLKLQGIGLDKERAQTILEVARQRGNEKDIAEAQNALWRIELQIYEAQAEGARKEAEAILLVVKARRVELEVSGQLTEAKKAELDAQLATAEAKKLDAERFDLLADRMKKLAYETKELKSSFLELSDSADEAAASADRAAGSYDGLRNSISAAAKAKDGWSRDTNGNIIAGGTDVSAAAAKNTNSDEQARIFESLFAGIYNRLKDRPEYFSSTQGLQTAAIERDAISQAKMESARQVQAANRGSPSSTPTASSFGNMTQVFRVDIAGLGGKTKSVNVASNADATALVSALQELATRS